MKKALVVLLGVLMAVMFAAESYAATEIGGTIDVRGRFRQNNNDLNDTRSGEYAVWQEKVNLWVDAKIAEGLKGYIELQSGGPSSSKGWMNWGTSRSSSSTYCTTGSNADVDTTSGNCRYTGTVTQGTDSAPNSMFYENRGLGFMEIRYAYIDFMIPGTPVGIKIGHMPIVVGHSIWANTGIWGSDGLMIYAVPMKELMVALGTIKGMETATSGNPSDIDMYGLHVLYTFIPKNSVGLNVNYLNRNGQGDISSDTRGESDMAFWNYMLTADGTFDFGLGYKFEADVQAGMLYDYEARNNSPDRKDVAAGGVALLLGVDYKIAGIAKVGMDIAYGSGDHCDRWSGSDYSTCADWGNSNEGYVNFNDYGYTMIYEDIVGQKRSAGTATAAGSLGTIGGLPHTTSRGTDFGLWNTMYVKLGASVTPIKDMSIGLDFYYLQAVEANIKSQKSDIGYEGDLKFVYNIYKNLAWTFMTGYFIPGGHYDKITTAHTPSVTSSETDSTKTTDAAWAFEQKLSLKF